MKSLRTTLTKTLPLFLLLCSCGGHNPVESNTASINAATTLPSGTEVGLVSMIQLLSDPEKFNGKRIQVVGFVHLEFEGNAIYLNRDDFLYGIEKNALWLSIQDPISDFRELNDSYVLVEGTFNADEKGHVRMWSGSLEKITKLKRWAKVKTP